jgi:hypothetical protein
MKLVRAGRIELPHDRMSLYRLPIWLCPYFEIRSRNSRRLLRTR